MNTWPCHRRLYTSRPTDTARRHRKCYLSQRGRSNPLSARKDILTHDIHSCNPKGALPLVLREILSILPLPRYMLTTYWRKEHVRECRPVLVVMIRGVRAYKISGGFMVYLKKYTVKQNYLTNPRSTPEDWRSILLLLSLHIKT